MDSQVYIKFVVVDPFFIYTKFEYFDHFIDKKRDDNAKCDTNLTAVCRKMTNFIIFEAKIPCFKLENS